MGLLTPQKKIMGHEPWAKPGQLFFSFSVSYFHYKSRDEVLGFRNLHLRNNKSSYNRQLRRRRHKIFPVDATVREREIWKEAERTGRIGTHVWRCTNHGLHSSFMALSASKAALGLPLSEVTLTLTKPKPPPLSQFFKRIPLLWTSNFRFFQTDNRGLTLFCCCEIVPELYLIEILL